MKCSKPFSHLYIFLCWSKRNISGVIFSALWDGLSFKNQPKLRKITGFDLIALKSLIHFVHMVTKTVFRSLQHLFHSCTYSQSLTHTNATHTLLCYVLSLIHICFYNLKNNLNTKTLIFLGTWEKSTQTKRLAVSVSVSALWWAVQSLESFSQRKESFRRTLASFSLNGV